MELKFSETNRGKPCLIFDGYTYRKDHVLEKGDVVYRCSFIKSCKATVTLDSGETLFIKNMLVTKERLRHNNYVCAVGNSL